MPTTPGNRRQPRPDRRRAVPRPDLRRRGPARGRVRRDHRRGMAPPAGEHAGRGAAGRRPASGAGRRAAARVAGPGPGHDTPASADGPGNAHPRRQPDPRQERQVIATRLRGPDGSRPGSQAPFTSSIPATAADAEQIRRTRPATHHRRPGPLAQCPHPPPRRPGNPRLATTQLGPLGPPWWRQSRLTPRPSGSQHAAGR